MSTTPEGAKRRLSNIRPREVSLVYAAANGHRFLMVKRADYGGAMNEAFFFMGGKPAAAPAAGCGKGASALAPSRSRRARTRQCRPG